MRERKSADGRPLAARGVRSGPRGPKRRVTGALQVSHAVAALFLLAHAAPAAAQIDYRNLDDERPLVTEDAYPIERYAFELLAPYRFERERGGGRLHLVVPEIGYAPLYNTQIGIEAPLAALDEGPGADTRWGLAGLGAYGFYNLNTEGRLLPAIALRAEVSLPVGSLAGNATRVALKGIATRTWGRTRFHVNALRGFGSEDETGQADLAPRWRYTLAADRTLLRQSLLVAAEVLAERSVRGAPVAVNAGLGLRYQWRPTLVIDVGVVRRLRDATGPDYGFTVGLSHAFAWRALMPTGPR